MRKINAFVPCMMLGMGRGLRDAGLGGPAEDDTMLAPVGETLQATLSPWPAQSVDTPRLITHGIDRPMPILGDVTLTFGCVLIGRVC